MKRRAIIIGSSGQDGRLLTALLRSKGYDVTGVNRKTHDISDPSQIEKLIRTVAPDELYYLAAIHQSSEMTSSTNSLLLEESFSVNALFFGYFLQKLVEFMPKCAIFYASSSHIFPSQTSNKLIENSEKKPESIYAITKCAGMQLCEYYRWQFGLKASVGILFNHESSLRSSGYLSKRIAQAAASISRTGQGYLMLGDLDAVVDWGAAEDYVDAMHRILQLGAGDDFVIATGQMHSVACFAEIAFQYVGLDYRNHVKVNPKIITRPPRIRCGNPAKLMKATGWQTTVTFSELVKRLVEYELTRLTQPKGVFNESF